MYLQFIIWLNRILWTDCILTGAYNDINKANISGMNDDLQSCGRIMLL